MHGKFTKMYTCILLRCIFYGKLEYLYLFTCTYIGIQNKFPYQMMFVSFNSNMTGVTSGAGTPYPSVISEFTSIF